MVCHRRFGKTVMAINHLLKCALTCERERPRFGYLAPTYKQAKTVAWDYLKHYARAIPGMVANEQELRVDLPNGGQVRLHGADNPDALRGIYLDGVVPDEFGLMQGKVWSEVLRPALADRLGWAMFIGTPNGKNAFWKIRDYASRTPGWFLIEYKASQTGILPTAELEAARALMTQEEYEQEFECSFEASVRGAVYAKEIAAIRASNRTGNVPYDPALPVYTWWDLGIGDSTAIGFVQVLGQEVRAIDYHEASGEGFPYYAKVLADKGYVYGKHYAPHDIQVRELGSGRSRIETAQALGIRFETAPNVPLEDGIHATRMFLPRMWFDQNKCFAWLEALTNYRWAENKQLGELKPTPVHDWTSHAADMTRYGALSTKEKFEPKRVTVARQFGGEGAWMG